MLRGGSWNNNANNVRVANRNNNNPNNTNNNNGFRLLNTLSPESAFLWKKQSEQKVQALFLFVHGQTKTIADRLLVRY